MPKPEKTAAKADNAKGQTKERTYVSPEGVELISTKAQFKATLKAQGYVPLDDDDDDDDGVDETPVDTTPVTPVS